MFCRRRGFASTSMRSLGLRDPDLAAVTVADVLGVRPEPGRPVLDTLTEAAGGRSLLVLPRRRRGAAAGRSLLVLPWRRRGAVGGRSLLVLPWRRRGAAAGGSADRPDRGADLPAAGW